MAQTSTRSGTRSGGKRTSKKVSVVVKRTSGTSTEHNPFRFWLSGVALVAGALGLVLLIRFHQEYTVALQSPLQLHWQWPLVVAERTRTADAVEAQADQHSALTPYQQYACRKFGSVCRTALAIQRAENPKGQCEIYHYNTDGTLDWGYFQINTVHLKRPGLNLRDLLDCRANIDFAYQLYLERGNFTAWSTYNNGLYRRYLRE